MKTAQINRLINSKHSTPSATDLYELIQFWNITDHAKGSNHNKTDIKYTPPAQMIPFPNESALNQLESSNFNIDDQGRRRGTRIRRKRKQFFDDSFSDEDTNN